MQIKEQDGAATLVVWWTSVMDSRASSFVGGLPVASYT